MNVHTMNTDPFQQARLNDGRQPGWLSKLLAFVIGTGVMILGFMFSLVALAVVAVLAVIAGIWFWWKTRALRRQLREQAPDANTAWQTRPMPSDGDIIEGEARREHDTGEAAPRLLK